MTAPTPPTPPGLAGAPASDPADVPIRDAATVVLLRDGVDGVEAWLLTRVTQMVFAAGMTVFPGGRVDDADADLPFVGTAGVDLAARFGCDERLARALLGAAVREVYEETGVLLTVPAADLSAARSDVEAGRIRFGDLLRENGLAIDGSGLLAWARWITPVGESRRYDTRFFVAALPAGAQAQDVTTESSAASWRSVGGALEQVQRGEFRALPPTLITLGELAGFATVADVLAAAPERLLEPVRPNVRLTEAGDIEVELPDGRSLSIPRGVLR